MNYAALLPLAVGLVILYIGIKGIMKKTTAKRSDEYQETTGTICGHERKVEYNQETQRDDVSYFPIVEYYVNGMRYTHTLKVGNNRQKGFGKPVKLIYNIHDPSDVMKKGDTMPYFNLALGVLLVVASIIILSRG